MRKIRIIFILFCCQQLVIAQTPKDLKSTIKEATIFTNGAQIIRSANINLQPGVSELVFEGISPYTNIASIQPSGKGNFVILDSRHNIKYPEPADNPEILIPAALQHKIETTQDTLNEINYDYDVIKDRKDLYSKQKDMLSNNPLMRGGGKSDSLPILKDAMEFFNTKMNSINVELQKIKREESKVLIKRTQLQTRYNDLLAYKERIISEKTSSNAPIYQVIVTVSAKEAVTGTLSISYICSNAGWTPSYDIRVNDINAPVELAFKANVYQNTGEDWNNVKLKLSTNNPIKSNIKPYLSSWYLNYYMPVSAYTSNLQMGTNAPAAASYEKLDAMKDEDISKKLPSAQLASNYTTEVQNLTAMEYSIELPYSIPSDGKYHLVYVHNQDNISTTYNYFAAPKIDKDAFLIAKLSGWEDLNLLAAKANIYFEGGFVGETIIDPNIIADTLELSLGRDRGIAIQRKKLKDKEKEQIVGNSRSKTISMEVSVKNNKNTSIDMVLEDQIPMSNDKDIKVSFDSDNFTGNYNETTGMLSWKMKLKPKENKIVNFTYTIKYDKDRNLILN
ncbi:MAG: mucoidy inhibitor MuiA family protein [Bacteroidetes bacterium]|nr:mucoidy inhibitor MuiA family protein [Bacteroidota bacterium]